MPKQTADIGIWENVFRIMALLSVITNVGVIPILTNHTVGLELNSIFQSLQIALTSQAISKITFYFDHDYSIEGYVNYIYSQFNVDRVSTFFKKKLYLNKIIYFF